MKHMLIKAPCRIALYHIQNITDVEKYIEEFFGSIDCKFVDEHDEEGTIDDIVKHAVIGYNDIDEYKLWKDQDENGPVVTVYLNDTKLGVTHTGQVIRQSIDIYLLEAQNENSI